MRAQGRGRPCVACLLLASSIQRGAAAATAPANATTRSAASRTAPLRRATRQRQGSVNAAPRALDRYARAQIARRGRSDRPRSRQLRPPNPPTRQSAASWHRAERPGNDASVAPAADQHRQLDALAHATRPRVAAGLSSRARTCWCGGAGCSGTRVAAWVVGRPAASFAVRGKGKGLTRAPNGQRKMQNELHARQKRRQPGSGTTQAVLSTCLGTRSGARP